MKSKKKKAKTGKGRFSPQAQRFEMEMSKANKLLQSGQLQQAANIFREILRRKPDHGGALHMLGIAHARAGDLEMALDLLRQSIKAEPHNPDFLYNLARVYDDQGRHEQAISVYREYLHFKPDDVEALSYLGKALFAAGKSEEALDCFQRTLQYNPESADASYNIGVIYAAQGRVEEAILAYRQALNIRPDNSMVYCALGKVLGEKGSLDEAIACFEQALRYDPEYIEAYYNLGVLYNTQGRMEDALHSYQQALAIRPEYTVAYCALAKLKKFSREDRQIGEMEQLFGRKDITDGQRMYLAFGLGKALEDCGEYEQAFAYLREGNRLKRKSYEYSIAESRTEFKQIKDIFSSSFIYTYQEVGNPDDTPMFILGMPRSGTSLVEQILASHPSVYGAGELLHVRNTIFELTVTRQVGSALVKLTEEADRLIPGFAAAYLEKIREHGANVRHVTDKMPHNFLFIGLIRLALPKAKIVHCLRDPMDNCFSIYKQLFTGEHKYAYDLEELGRYYLLYRDLMQYWHQLFPDIIYDISYEALVEDQEGETRKLLQHCGLPWDDSCLSFHDTTRKVTTASLAQVRKPIYKSSVQLWRQYEEQLQDLKLILTEGGAVH